jgi:hypothetical protein
VSLQTRVWAWRLRPGDGGFALSPANAVGCLSGMFVGVGLNPTFHVGLPGAHRSAMIWLHTGGVRWSVFADTCLGVALGPGDGGAPIGAPCPRLMLWDAFQAISDDLIAHRRCGFCVARYEMPGW